MENRFGTLSTFLSFYIFARCSLSLSSISLSLSFFLFFVSLTSLSLSNNSHSLFLHFLRVEAGSRLDSGSPLTKNLLENCCSVAMHLEERNGELQYPRLQQTVVVGFGPISVLLRHTCRLIPPGLVAGVAPNVASVGEHRLGRLGEPGRVPPALVQEPGGVERLVEPRQIRDDDGPVGRPVRVREEEGPGVGRDGAVLAQLEGDAAAFDDGIALHEAVGEGQVGDVLVQVGRAAVVEEEAVEDVGQLNGPLHLLLERLLEVLLVEVVLQHDVAVMVTGAVVRASVHEVVDEAQHLRLADVLLAAADRREPMVQGVGPLAGRSGAGERGSRVAAPPLPLRPAPLPLAGLPSAGQPDPRPPVPGVGLVGGGRQGEGRQHVQHRTEPARAAASRHPHLLHRLRSDDDDDHHHEGAPDDDNDSLECCCWW